MLHDLSLIRTIQVELIRREGDSSHMRKAMTNEHTGNRIELDLQQPERLLMVAHALSVQARLDIIRLLGERNRNVIELAEALQLPVSTAANHVKVLESAGLIRTELQPASRGAMKVCSFVGRDLYVNLNASNAQFAGELQTYSVEMPIGHYTDCEVYPTCGMASADGMLVREDEPASFYYPKHVGAQLIWFGSGFVEYLLPLEVPQHARITSIALSVEMCSETQNYDNDWPSDITVWINDVEIGTWTSPGDFGDRRGKQNPPWWPDSSTQYGMLTNWRVDKLGTTLNDQAVSLVTVSDLLMEGRPNVRIRIGVKDDAANKGGVNLFGRGFGDYEQDLVMEIGYME